MSGILDFQIDKIKEDFADYCANCRDGIWNCPENVKFRDDSPGAIHLLLRYLDQIKEKHENEIENLKGEKFNMDVQINDLSQEIEQFKEKLDISIKAGEVWKKEAFRLKKWEDSHIELTKRYDENYEHSKKLKADISMLKEALEFYASFESDENGFGGVNGDGLYVIRMSGYYVLDKGKTAQNALKKLGGNHGA